MKKITFVILILVIFLVGSSQKNNQNNENLNDNEIKTDKKEISSIDELLLNLENNFELGEKKETYYQMIGAYDGTKIDVDGIKIEIYQYKDSQKNAMESAKDAADTVDNQVFVLKDNFLILIHSKDTDFSNKLKQSVN